MIILSKPNIPNNPLSLRIQGSINTETISEFEKVLFNCSKIDQPILPLIIDSPGGCPYSLISLYENIKKSKIKIATIVESKALSCAAILLSCGSKGYRYMSKNATIMIHDVKTTYNGKTEDAKADSKETERLNDLMYKILEDNCKKKNNYFKKIMQENRYSDLYLNSNECLDYGIIDAIGVPKLKVKIKYKLSL